MNHNARLIRVISKKKKKGPNCTVSVMVDYFSSDKKIMLVVNCDIRENFHIPIFFLLLFYFSLFFNAYTIVFMRT